MVSSAIPAPQLEKITAAIPGVVYQFHVGRDGTWTFLYLSPGIRELYEVEPAEVYADHHVMTSCILEEDRASHQQSVADSMVALSPWFHEHRIRTRSNQVKWIRGQAIPESLADGSVLWNGILTDITEQKRVEDELRISRELLEERNLLLAAYQQDRQSEEQFAKDIVDKLIAAHLPAETCVRHWTRPVNTFNGDIIAYARSPKGLVYILFADAAGHGLPAAICAVPILPLFYRLVEMCLPIEAIARNLNKTLKTTLPDGRFVSACLTSFNPGDGHVRLWNAGMPDVLHVDAHGNVLRRYESRNPPLGIIDFRMEANSTAGIHPRSGDRLIYVSDGVSEAGMQCAAPFGIARVEELLLTSSPDQFMPNLQAALNAHAGQNPFHDDASVMELLCVY